MNKLERKKLEKIARILQILTVIALLAPIVLYIYTFGLKISGDHARWSEMGSAMSGIYTPILALLTLLVLVIQLRVQSEMNKLAHDQAYIVEAREDIQYHLLQITNELSKSCRDNINVSLKHVLTTKFRYASINDLQKSDFKDAAAHIQNCNSHIQSNWAAIYAIFAGLSVNDEPVYTNNFGIAKSKATALLSYECCVALDNFDWCLWQNKVSKKYEFSEALNLKI